jgi:GNAT superfamily N-acetyltransferase
MNIQKYIIRNARPEEYPKIGDLLVDVYSQLDGFPKESEQPEYYKTLRHTGTLTASSETELLVAISVDERIGGAVVYYGNMKYYGSGGTATLEQNASGFRFLAVDPLKRRQGIGQILVKECIRKARESKRTKIIIHSTKAMQAAWKMYEHLGFKRFEDLDFKQGDLSVFGFRLLL